MKAGATGYLKIAVPEDFEVASVAEIIFTARNGSATVSKSYPMEVQFDGEQFLLPLNQQETTSLQGSVWVEAQINHLDGSVTKSEKTRFVIGDTLATKFMDNNQPGDDEADIYLSIEPIQIVMLGDGGGVVDAYTKAQTNALLATKADKGDVYTKAEVNTSLEGKANTDDVYTKSEIDTKLENLPQDAPDLTDYYTKSESDRKFALKGEGTVSDEQIAEAVENYLTENPISGGNDIYLHFAFANNDVANFNGTAYLFALGSQYIGKDFSLMWADDNGIMTEYAPINQLIPIEGKFAEKVSYSRFVDVQGIPEGATKLCAVADNAIKASFIIPASKRFGGFGQKKYSIGLASDVHCGWSTVTDRDGVRRDVNAEEDWARACQKFVAKNVDAIVVSGDVTYNSSNTEFNNFVSIKAQNAPNIPCYASAGNHDSKPNAFANAETFERSTAFLNAIEAENYTKTINGDLWVFLGVHTWGLNNNETLSESQLTWLENILEAHRNERVFLVFHVFLQEKPTSYEGKFNGNANNRYSLDLLSPSLSYGAKFEELIGHYKNVVWFNGHSHIHYEYQEEDLTLNWRKGDYCTMLHLGSCSGPRFGDSGVTYDSQASEIAFLDVYENHIVFKGYEFEEASGDGHFEPIAYFVIDTTPITIEAKPSEGGGEEEPDTPTTQYTLTFSVDGGSNVASITADEGSVIDLSTYTTSKNGYTFDGWYSEQGLTNKVTSIILDGNKTVYAKFTEVSSGEDTTETEVTNIVYTKGKIDYSSNGEIVTATDYSYSNEIYVGNNNTIRIRIDSTALTSYTADRSVRVVAYNADGMVGYSFDNIAHVPKSTTDTAYVDDGEYSLPQGTTYVRIRVYDKNVNNNRFDFQESIKAYLFNTPTSGIPSGDVENITYSKGKIDTTTGILLSDPKYSYSNKILVGTNSVVKASLNTEGLSSSTNPREVKIVAYDSANNVVGYTNSSVIVLPANSLEVTYNNNGDYVLPTNTNYVRLRVYMTATDSAFTNAIGIKLA